MACKVYVQLVGGEKHVLVLESRHQQVKCEDSVFEAFGLALANFALPFPLSSHLDCVGCYLLCQSRSSVVGP